jgi:hypothetical protein
MPGDQADASLRHLYPVPAAGRPVAPKGLSRFRRRIDGMLAEMLGDDAAEPVESASAEPDDSLLEAGAGPDEDSFWGPDERRDDESFWGPGERGDGASSLGYRSKHRLTDPASEPKRADGQRNVPRHAAPPVSFSAKLTGRYAAHAAW